MDVSGLEVLGGLEIAVAAASALFDCIGGNDDVDAVCDCAC